MPRMEADLKDAVDTEEARRAEEEELRLVRNDEDIWDDWPRKNGRTKLISVKKSPFYR